MNIHTLLENILKASQDVGTYPLSDLISTAKSKLISGIAVAKDPEKELYIAFMGGEPQGAVYLDEKGVLFGDQAVLLINGTESFLMKESRKDVIETLIMSSRI